MLTFDYYLRLRWLACYLWGLRYAECWAPSKKLMKKNMIDSAIIWSTTNSALFILHYRVYYWPLDSTRKFLHQYTALYALQYMTNNQLMYTYVPAMLFSKSVFALTCLLIIIHHTHIHKCIHLYYQ